MAPRTDFYAVLGVSATSDDVVIRAAFKALMLKYHPDTNKSADATRRAAAINEAYGVLGDPQRRAFYDQSRSKGGRSSPPPPPPPPPSPPASPPKTPPRPKTVATAPRQPGWFARLGGLLAVVIVVGAIRVGMREAINPSTSVPAFASASEPMPVNTMTVEQVLNAQYPKTTITNAPDEASAPSGILPPEPVFSFQPATSIDFKVIEGAAGEFAKVLNRSGMVGARAWSQDCHEQAAKTPSWTAADRCAAFDYAARYLDQGMATTANIRPNSYFVFSGRQSGRQLQNRRRTTLHGGRSTEAYSNRRRTHYL